LHFPDIDLLSLNHEEMKRFLKDVDLSKVNFNVKIADFGLSKEIDNPNEFVSSFCGTALYMSP